MENNSYKQFELNQIKPTGWLKKQLEIQAKGLSGNLHKVWPDVRDSAWIGGDRESAENERTPYWLDGAIPLAYLVGDAGFIEEVTGYVEAIIDNQKPSGWICPADENVNEKTDLWSSFLIGKVLSQYVVFTGDERAYGALKKLMKRLYGILSDGSLKLRNWGKSRWFEALVPLYFISRREKEPWVKPFARILKKQGEDWASLTERWKRPLNTWTFQTHIVNIAMMIKYDALYCAITGEKSSEPEKALWDLLSEYNGTAVGTLTGDECLSGIGADHGTELCSVVELMYSFETLFALTGDPVWADRLEKVAFNALPATLSDDMWSHQYDQTVNQISCINIPGRKFFRTNANDAGMFGLEPHYGCCTANFSQGWPKFAENAFLRSEKGVVVPVIMPAELDTEIDGVPVKISCKTEYPFRFSALYTVRAKKKVRFELKIRVPEFARSLKIDGKKMPKSRWIVIDGVFEGASEIEIAFEDTPRLVSRPGGMKVAEYGPLVFCLPLKERWERIEYEKDGVERKFPYCDWSVTTKDEWRYGFAGGELEVVEKKGDPVPFSSKKPRIALKTKLERVDWEFYDGYENIAARYPVSNASLGEEKEAELAPYGCAKLRMTEMPKVRGKKK
ncbi:MAG: glycoside hydrolase family 127 protein [Clostridia bacterium]|nr:glycoside hydrolase family 127 protein [Clostridia bacterium]